MKIWWNTLKEHFMNWSARACSAVVILAALGILFCLILHSLKPNTANFFESQHTISVANKASLTEQEQLNLEKLIAKNKVIPVSVVYENSVKYYDSLISILGFLIAVLGIFVGFGAFLSYISMKSKIKDGIKEELEKELESVFFQAYIKDIAEASTEKQISEKLPDWLKNRDNTIEEIVDMVKNKMEKDRDVPLLVPADDAQNQGGEG